jgi:hypothetical protein
MHPLLLEDTTGAIASQLVALTRVQTLLPSKGLKTKKPAAGGGAAGFLNG